MSFLRKMFSGKVGPDDPRRFLVEAMLGAMEADGEVMEEEMATLEGNLGNHPLFEGLSNEELSRMTDVAADAIREAGGGKARADAIAKGLPSRSQRLAAYSMACEVCVADNHLAQSEIDFPTSSKSLALEDSGPRSCSRPRAKHSGLLTLDEVGSRAADARVRRAWR
jgi:uncharacterized tellurite resistance protein B-like protein